MYLFPVPYQGRGVTGILRIGYALLLDDNGQDMREMIDYPGGLGLAVVRFTLRGAVHSYTLYGGTVIG